MTQEELKTLLLTHVNLNEFSAAEIERFFSECAGITVENFQEKFLDWQNSKSCKAASIQIEKELSFKRDTNILRGLAAIQRKDYFVLDNTRRQGTYVVKNAETGLFGLITEQGEEILPCIVNCVSVKLDNCIEVGFKGIYMNPTHEISFCDKELALSLAHDDYDDRYGFTYGDNGGLILFVDQMDEATKQLIDLLSINHSFPKQEQ